MRVRSIVAATLATILASGIGATLRDTDERPSPSDIPKIERRVTPYGEYLAEVQRLGYSIFNQLTNGGGAPFESVEPSPRFAGSRYTAVLLTNDDIDDPDKQVLAIGSVISPVSCTGETEGPRECILYNLRHKSEFFKRELKKGTMMNANFIIHPSEGIRRFNFDPWPKKWRRKGGNEFSDPEEFAETLEKMGEVAGDRIIGALYQNGMVLHLIDQQLRAEQP